MALINREELLNAFGLSEKTRKYGGDHSGYDTRMLYEIQDTIEDAAAVDAIPVAWIKEKIQTLRNENSYTSYHLSECYKALLLEWKRVKGGELHETD